MESSFLQAVLTSIFLFGTLSLTSCRGNVQIVIFVCMLLFLIVVFLWLVELFRALSYYIVGYLSQDWFYSTYDPDVGHKIVPSGRLLEAYSTALQFHMGSFCYAAIVNVGVKPIRFVLGLITPITRRFGSSRSGSVERTIAPYSDSAILAIVLDGPGYLDACNEANQILAGEDSNRPDSILLGMRIVCACATSACVTLAVWLGIHFMLRDLEGPEIVLAAFLMAQLCSWSFVECLGHTAEALLFTYRAGRDGYLGIAVMVGERTGLFEMPECVGGQVGLAQPPKLSQLLPALN
ncbi:unnamed protein product [Durusdinium trenchii]|uniref:Choline transporter-like protein n=1 Tax=Durusdinium trenchii TaxID=1381693 RepID=A0ABP0M5V6_9DINO